MNIITLTRVDWDSSRRVIIKEEMYINTMHIHLFKSVPSESTQMTIVMRDQGCTQLTIITVGNQHFYVTETPKEIQRKINFLQQ